MTIKFINREDELDYLKKEYAQASFRFISITGRRRVGKTRLVEEFLKGKDKASYFLLQELNDSESRLSLAERLHKDLGFSFLGTPAWDDIFETLFKESEKIRIVFVIDEFQRFLNINKAVPSIIQKYIDKFNKNSKLFFIVMGSSIGMMHKIFDHSSALYGRRTGQIYVQPLRISALKEWFPNLPIEKRIKIYSIFGGTPKYLEEVEKTDSVLENIKNKILSKSSILYNEPENLIKTELPDSATYLNILKLIAQGKTKSSEIADALTIKSTSISYFLNILKNDLDIIKKEVPVTEAKPEKSKKTVYSIKDNYFKFWFKYIHPNSSDIEIENTGWLFKKIEQEIPKFIGEAFEEICKEILIKLNNDKNLPFLFSKIGRWWGQYYDPLTKNKKSAEIDIIAFNYQIKKIIFVECKWKEDIDAEEILKQLKEKSKYVDWSKKNREEYFCIIAKSFKKKVKEENVLLFDLEDIEKILSK